MDVMLDSFLPQTDQLGLRPERWIDHLALPFVQHQLVLPYPLTHALCRRLHGEQAVVSYYIIRAQNVIQGLFLHVKSDIGRYQDVMRRNFAAPDLNLPYTHIHWYLIITHRAGHIPPPLPTPAMRAFCDIPHGLYNVISGRTLRGAILANSMLVPNIYRQLVDQLNVRSHTGDLAVYSLSKVPTEMHLTTDGRVMIVNDLVARTGPWAVTRADLAMAITLASINNDLGQYHHPPATLGPRLTPAAVPPRLDVQPGAIFGNGRFAPKFRDVIKQEMIRVKRAIQPLVNILPHVGPVPPLPPRVPKWVILIRFNSTNAPACFKSSVRQLLSQIRLPPNGISPNLGNVDQIQVILERFGTLSSSLASRPAIQNLLTVGNPTFMGPQDIITTINPTGFTTHPGEIAMFMQLFPNAHTQGLHTVQAGAYQGVDEEDKPVDLDDLYEENNGAGNATLATWHVFSPAVNGYLRTQSNIERERSFYSSSHTYMERWRDTAMPNIKAAITRYMQTHGLTRSVGYRRISRGALGDVLKFNKSLQRQMEFVNQYLPAGSTLLELRKVSISRDGSAVVKLLAPLENALVVVSSIDRVARSTRGMESC
jgi:hypothetical protein